MNLSLKQLTRIMESVYESTGISDYAYVVTPGVSPEHTRVVRKLRDIHPALIDRTIIRSTFEWCVENVESFCMLVLARFVRLVILLPDWEKHPHCQAEVRCANALDIPIREASFYVGKSP
jgi:hypothetical protein